MKRLIALFIALVLSHTSFNVFGQQKLEFKFAVIFKDKDTVLNNFQQPERYLSEKAISRRKAKNVVVDWYDIPVNSQYINALIKAGFKVRNTSKWFNCAIVFTPNKQAADSLKKLPGVKDVIDVGFGVNKVTSTNANPVELDEKVALLEQKFIKIKDKYKQDTNVYGAGYNQVEMIGVNKLHQMGLSGAGTTIALIDAGYRNAHKHIVFKQALKQVVSTYDFVDLELNVFDNDDHGTAVWSCIASNDSFNFIGTAPASNFILLRSEDAITEFPVEEFYWAMAAEYADSAGADIISTSLGYNEFDHERYNYEHKNLNGKTAWITQAANIATNKGLFVLVSAGNEGDNSWKKIAFPADAIDVVTVGAVDKKQRLAGFSSVGLTTDGRTKPDLMAMGENSTIASDLGTIYEGDGTSYSCPVLAGGVACLWPYFNTYSTKQIIQWLHLSGSNYYKPDKYFGYGVPDLFLAYQFTQSYTTDTLLNVVRLDDKNHHLTLFIKQKEKLKVTLKNELGKTILSQSESIKVVGFTRFKLHGSKKLKKGVYTLQIITNTKNINYKLVVQ
jgi:hypothetical protein